MRGSSARVVLAAVVVAAIGTTTVPPASADPLSHSSWSIRQDAAGGQPAQDLAYEESEGVYFGASGTATNVRVSLWSAEVAWEADFSAPAGRQLQTGQTFDLARSDEVGDSARPGLSVASDERHCGMTVYDHDYAERSLSIGRFTVQEAAYDVNGQVVRFAVTFEQNCQDTQQPAIEGSVAVNATDPAVAVPPASPTPGPITGIKIANVTTIPHTSSNWTTLTWQNPEDSGWAETVVGAVNWEPVPTRVGLHDTVYRGGGERLVTWTDAVSPYYVFRLTPVSATGRLGPTSVVRLKGTRLFFQAGAQPVTMGEPALLSGRLLESVESVDPESGPGLAGKAIDIYRQPKGGPNGWSLLKRVTTGPGGRFSVVDTPDANTQYQAVFRGTPVHFGNANIQPAIALVAPQADLSSARKGVKRRSAIRFSTSRSTAGSRSVVMLQRHNGRTWETVATKRIQPAKASRAPKRMVIRFRAKARGLHAFRLVKPGDSRHVTGYSRTVRVTVR